MATITGFSVVDYAGLPVLADPFGNNVAFRCLGCGAPVLAVALEHQRGSSTDNPSKCPACGSSFRIEVDDVRKRVTVYRVPSSDA